jgi:threonine dehydrogenase-like Zn-dependent dehydrogenase
LQAAIFKGEGVISVEEQEEPSVEAPDDVVIAVEINGLCGSDLRALMVPPQMDYVKGVTIGHEFAGTVVGVGSAVSRIEVGNRVVAIPNINCQTCWYCLTNRTNLCENFVHIGGMIDGGAAAMVKVPARLVLEIPAGLSTELASIAEPLACVLNGTRTADVQPGDTVVVFGAGPIGLLYMLVLQSAGASVIVSEPNDRRREFAASLGADLALNPVDDDLAEAVMTATAGRGADVAVDSVGRLLADAVSVLRKGGQALVFGLDDLTRVEVSPAAIAYGELKVSGVYIAKGTFPTALQMLEENSQGFERILTHKLPLENVADAIDLARRGEAIKVAVLPNRGH